MNGELHPIQIAWIEQIKSIQVSQFVNLFGDNKRIDVTLYADRGNTPKPPGLTGSTDFDVKVV